MELKTVLPSGITQAIKTAATSKAQEQRLTRLSRYIFRKYLYDGIPFEEPIEISKAHFRNQVSSHYLPDLDALRDARIIVTDHAYTLPLTDPITGERLALGQCKRHYFAPDLIFSDPAIIQYSETARQYITGDQVTRQTAQLLSKIRIAVDERNLAQYVADLVTPQYIRARYHIGEEIAPGFYHVTGFKYPLDRDRLIEIARRNGLDLIEHKGKCTLAPADKYLADKLLEIRNRYLASLIALKQARKRPAIYCSRNERNRRLDHNLTAIKSELLSLVRLDGEPLVSIDLSNSQFRFLALLIEIAQTPKHITKFFMRRPGGYLHEFTGMDNRGEDINIQRLLICIINVAHFYPKNRPKTEIKGSFSSDLERFKKLTKEGKFYEDLANEMTLADGREYTRADAKNAMFVAAFSSHRYQPPIKKLLARIYPTLVQWIDAFKRAAIAYYLEQGEPKEKARDLGDAELAVALQNVESLIFVDGILADLLSRGFRVFSKHDSILCKQSDAPKVAQVIREHLDAVFGAGGYQMKMEKT